MADPRGVVLSVSATKQLSKGKKRKIQIDEWRDIKNKKLRNAGKEYTTRKGVNKPAKPEPVLVRLCSCKHKGCMVIFDDEKCTPENRRKYYDIFYKLNYNEQTRYLESKIKLNEVKRRVVQEAVSRRHCTVEYFINVNKEDHKVCRKTFCGLFQVTPRRLQVLQEKMKQGLTTADIYDRRGLHQNRPHAVTADIRAIIKAHIDNFPKQESHYSRQGSAKYYLSSELNLKRMFRDFKAKNSELQTKIGMYRNIFNSEFNLKFGAPRSDTCSFCDRMYMKCIASESEEEKRKIHQESTLHHLKAENSYKYLKADTEASKNGENNVVLCVDLQQVLFCPTLTHSDVFYQRQYSTYNFAIHNMGKNQATMCVWHESVAKRGSAEIAACILKYITLHFEKLSPGATRSLVVWSDRCVGQNNHWRIIALYHYIMNMGYFTEIHQKFLVSGHSFLPCDRDFALIEKAKKVTKIYHPKQWVELITQAKENNPFLVYYMEREDFLDISGLEASLNRPKDLKITNAQWINLSSQNPSEIKVRESHNILRPWYSHGITKKARGVRNQYLPPFTPSLSTLKTIYQDSLPIKQEKKTNLISMCAYIPLQYRAFYENLKTE